MAGKKKNGKKAAKKTINRRGHTYLLTPSGRKLEATGQLKIILDTMGDKALTSKEIAAKVDGKLETKQDSLRVVSFYMADLKANGHVKFGPKEKVAAAA
jgi:hypothetical protein